MSIPYTTSHYLYCKGSGPDYLFYLWTSFEGLDHHLITDIDNYFNENPEGKLNSVRLITNLIDAVNDVEKVLKYNISCIDILIVDQNYSYEYYSMPGMRDKYDVECNAIVSLLAPKCVTWFFNHYCNIQGRYRMSDVKKILNDKMKTDRKIIMKTLYYENAFPRQYCVYELSLIDGWFKVDGNRYGLIMDKVRMNAHIYYSNFLKYVTKIYMDIQTITILQIAGGCNNILLLKCEAKYGNKYLDWPDLACLLYCPNAVCAVLENVKSFHYLNNTSQDCLLHLKRQKKLLDLVIYTIDKNLEDIDRKILENVRHYIPNAKITLFTYKYTGRDRTILTGISY